MGVYLTMRNGVIKVKILRLNSFTVPYAVRKDVLLSVGLPQIIVFFTFTDFSEITHHPTYLQDVDVRGYTNDNRYIIDTFKFK